VNTTKKDAALKKEQVKGGVMKKLIIIYKMHSTKINDDISKGKKLVSGSVGKTC
jgi:hypothetical protein